MSERITSLRWISIALVVLIHAVQWPYFHSSVAGFRLEPVFGWVYMAVIYGLGIGAVPVFFLLSGYLQFVKPRRYKDTVLKKIKGLLLPMLIWTALACFEYLLLKPWSGRIPQFAFLESSNTLDWLKGIFGDYSGIWSGTIGVPLLYQFWFIRDLFILSLLSPLIDLLLHKIPWVYMALCLLPLVFAKSVLVAPHALLFYSLGGICAIRDWDFFSFADKWIPWPLVIAGCVAAVFYVHSEAVYLDITSQFLAHVPTFFLLLKLSGILTSDRKLYALVRYMAPQSMFLYCSHAYMLIFVTGLLLTHVIDVSDTFGMIVFVLSLFLADLGLCTAAGILMCRYLPKTFSVLSGGR